MLLFVGRRCSVSCFLIAVSAIFVDVAVVVLWFACG